MQPKRIPVGQFKRTCLRVLEVRQTARPVLVTKRGTPVALVVPAPRERRDWAGCMRGSGRILGDIVAPAVELEEWEALRS
jgi:prevent-host-death family protein